MKKTLSIIALLLISLFAYFFVKSAGQNNSVDGNSVPMNIKTINEQSKLYSIQAEYPTFPSQKAFSDSINSYIADRISYFKKTSTENWQVLHPDKPFDFILSWSSSQINRDFVSFNIKLEYFVGGANLTQEIKTFNWNMKKNKKISLADLFPNDSNYLSTVSNYCRNNLIGQFAGQIIDDSLISEGTTPKLENFERFTFDKNKIIFYFPKAQVAPGANGEQTVIMYRNEAI